VIRLSQRQPILDQFDFMLWRCNSFFRFLLKSVKNVDGLSESYGINSPVCVSLVVLYDFQYSRSMKAFQRFGTSSGKARRSFLLLATQRSGFSVCNQTSDAL
jgi:hypothetical protein